MLQINTYGIVSAPLKLSKGDKEFLYYNDFKGDYEGLEVEALEDIKGNLENYLAYINEESKAQYIGVFTENFKIDYTDAIENYSDIKIDIIHLDFKYLKIEVEED